MFGFVEVCGEIPYLSSKFRIPKARMETFEVETSASNEKSFDAVALAFLFFAKL
jgi:hypothetical protein